MDAATKARAREILTEIQSDMEADTEKWEGKPLTGQNVAEMMGEVRGTIHGLAGVILRMLEEPTGG